MSSRAVAAVAVAIAFVACGGETDVSDTATAELRARTERIRELAAAGRPEEALAGLAELEVVLADLVAREEVTDDGAEDIRARAADVAAELHAITTTTTTTTAPPPPEEDDEDRDEERDEGRGNGNGNGGRDREDDD